MATKNPWALVGPVPIWKMDDGWYRYLAGMDIDGDGTGGRVDNDPTWQPGTSYKPYLNAKLDPWIVLPMVVIWSFPGQFLGCRCRVTNTLTGASTEAVGGDGGPNQKLGEGSIVLASILGVPDSPTTGGTTEPIILYEFQPGTPAVVNDKTYQLQSFIT